jgi:hypothetical protein
MDRNGPAIHLFGEPIPAERDHGPHARAICVIS